MPEGGSNRRTGRSGDRRRWPRGGRRASDQPGRWPTLLVADRHDDARGIHARYLGRLNFQIETAATAEEVFSVLRESRPAAVLLESRLPELPPWHLGVWLESDRKAPRTPIIVLEGVGGDDVGPSSPFEPSAVLSKPFELSHLVEAVRRALREVLPPVAGEPGVC